MMVMNPKIEIYLMDIDGKIMAFFAETGKTVEKEVVDTQPIRQFLTDFQKIPLLGDDPRQPEKRKPFSAAPISIGKNNQGYLYIERSRFKKSHSYLFNVTCLLTP